MAFETFPAKSRGEIRFAAFVVASGVAVGVLYHLNLWMPDATGFSMLQGRLPYWDFTNLWAGSKIAFEGHAGVLFDVDAYRAALRVMFSPDLPNQEWSYPPSMALFGAPLAQLPILVAYLLWTFGTVALLHVAIRPLGLPLAAHLAVLASPAVFMNAFFGQNGALTAALLLGGLLVAPKRPILAGILFGLLTVKPHLGILVPFCLIASLNWRAFVSAAATSAALALATGLIFGFESWRLFLSETRPLMTAIMEAPYPQHYHANALTVFVLARAAGGGLATAYAAQAVATVATVAVVVWLWLPSNPMDHRRRSLLTALLAIVATPYGYTYDMIPMCAAIVFLFVATPKPPLAPLALAWLFPYAAHILNFHGIGIGVLVPIALAIWMVARAPILRQSSASDPADTGTVEMSERIRTVVTESR